MAKAKTPAKAKGKAASAAEPTKRALRDAPDVRKRQNVASAGKRIPPEQIDESFLSEAMLAQRERFAHAYLASGNLADAAQTAGFNGNRASLRKAGFRLYHEPGVQARIEAIRADMLAELRISPRSVLAELSRIGFADMGQVVDENDKIRPLKDIPLDTRRALSKYKQTRRFISAGEDAPPIEEVETEVTFEGKLGALDKLAKHTGVLGKKDDEGTGLAADEFIKALAEGIARASKRPST